MNKIYIEDVAVPEFIIGNIPANEDNLVQELITYIYYPKYLTLFMVVPDDVMQPQLPNFLHADFEGEGYYVGIVQNNLSQLGFTGSEHDLMERVFDIFCDDAAALDEDEYM